MTTPKLRAFVSGKTIKLFPSWYPATEAQEVVNLEENERLRKEAEAVAKERDREYARQAAEAEAKAQALAEKEAKAEEERLDKVEFEKTSELNPKQMHDRTQIIVPAMKPASKEDVIMEIDIIAECVFEVHDVAAQEKEEEK